ncbi:oxidoreductase [Sorangium cellulosum]|uniref:Oxidoreductase n=1 Tax=Sorangium cellulosum TaxID=56 RepID=A0A2L0EYL6_SORCE|nr:Gfo/Idh/MocA family oxidoreductase [Sorangium cellulosum]AUX44355.1 oxidoreductase [Sorangium cellulosum]
MSGTRGPNKIRVGIIGASPDRGWAVATHLPALAALDGYEITAVSTTRQASADEAARRFGARHAFDRAEPLIEHPDVDLVVVSVRAPEHARPVRAAVAAKKDVFCEWPLGVSLAEATELAGAAEAAGVRTVIGLQRRLAPSVRHLRQLLDEGYLGKLRSVNIHAAVPQTGARRARSDAYAADVNSGANVLTIFAAHFLDTVFAVVGEPESLSSIVTRQFDQTTLIETGEVLPVTAPDQALIAGTLANGAVLSAHFEAGKRNGPVVSCTLTGTEGDIVLSQDMSLSGARGDGQPLQPIPTPEHLSWLPRSGLSDDAFQIAHVYAAFAKDLAEGTSVAPTFRDALKLHRLVDTIAQASAAERRLPWKG